MQFPNPTAEEIIAINEEFNKDMPLAKAAFDTTVENLIKLELMPEAIVAAASTTAVEALAAITVSRDMSDEDAKRAVGMMSETIEKHFCTVRASMQEQSEITKKAA